MSAVTHQFAGN